ncbi:WD-40 repeat-containing protein [Pholiota conissans]|uniref:ASTRA-associated protein 1 n=1 Tax=Pholiota conissans TaxID=109636 RepID=A0A9P6CP53_9AGAR|nr:WD-40 repeat-containing protein [Pholiota conissans]
MTDAPLAPTPLHLLRSHSAPISALAWSTDNERIYTADGKGKVVVTSTRSLRALASWAAHTDSVLGVEEWEKHIVTHGRDNKVHVWQRIKELPSEARIGGSAALPSLPTPVLCYSMDVNALNFCRFSLLCLSQTSEPLALIALPNLVDSSTADIWMLPSKERVHAAIGQEIKKPLLSENTGGRNTSGIITSLHLYQHNPAPDGLRLLTAYENGSVVLRAYNRMDKPVSIEGEGWVILWTSKLHVESIMAMQVSRTNDFALTVSADHIIGRYDLTDSKPADDQHGILFRTKHAGNGSVALRDDGRICAVGGWDGKIRLYSTKSLKPLGTLKYHKSACQCVEFAHQISTSTEQTSPIDAEEASDSEDEDEEMGPQEKAERARWLVSGSKDSRVAIWSLLNFGK